MQRHVVRTRNWQCMLATYITYYESFDTLTCAYAPDRSSNRVSRYILKALLCVASSGTHGD